MTDARRGSRLSRLAAALRRQRALLGASGVLLAGLAFAIVRADPYAATAHFEQNSVYLGDSAALVTVIVTNTGLSATIGAAQIRRPDGSWAFATCEPGPSGWSVQRSDPFCRYRSADGAADDIQVGASAAFSFRVSTDPGSADRVGTFQVIVSSSNQFDNPSLLTAAAERQAGLDLKAHSFEVVDAVVAEAPSSPGSACPAANREALVSSIKVIVVCGRNRANVALTPSAAHSSLGGTFLQSAGTFSSGAIAANSASSVVLGNWSAAQIRTLGGSDLTLVAVIAAGTTQTSPPTTLGGYIALNNPPVAGDDGPYSVLEDGLLSVPAPGVRANDLDPDGHPFTIALASAPTNGTASLNDDGSFTYEPADDYFGADSFMYTADDGHGGTDTATVLLSVTAVNDAPSFTLPVASHTSNEDGGPQSVPAFATAISAGPANESGQVLAFDVSNDNPSLFATGPLLSADGTLTYQAAANAFGSSTVTATLRDDGGTANGGLDASPTAQFTVTVNSVNDEPSFSLLADANQTVAEDAGTQTVPSFASSISAGPANESGQAVHFNVSNDSNGLFSTQPAIAADGTLTYRPADDAFGSAIVSVTAQDDGGTANGGVATSAPQVFTITVTPVNDAPTADAQSYGTAVGNTVLAVSRPATPGPVVHVTGSLLDGAADPDGPAPLSVVAGDVATTGGGSATLHADGTFTYLSAAGYDGLTDTFSYRVSDGSGAMSAPATVEIALSGDVVWYVDNSAAAAGDGRSNAPLSSLGALSAGADADDPGDILFLYTGNGPYGGGFALEADQELIGQPAGLTLVSQSLVAAGGARPNLAGAAGHGLTLAAGVSVRSIEISGSVGNGIAGTGLTGSMTLSDVVARNSGGDNASLLASSGTLTLLIDDSTFRDNDASTGGHGLRLTAAGTSTVSATVDDSTFRNNRVSGLRALTVGSGTLTVAITDGTFDTNFNGMEVVHASGGSLTATVARNAISSSTGNGGAPVNLFLSSQAGSDASSIFRATVDSNVITNSDSQTAPGIWFHTGASAGHARLLITGNDVSAVGLRGISVEAGQGSSTVDATIASNVISLPATAFEGIFVQAGVLATDTATVCADIRGNDSASPSSDIRVRQRFAGTTFRLPGYLGSGTDVVAVAAFLSAQNTVADVSASHDSATGFGGGGACSSP